MSDSYETVYESKPRKKRSSEERELESLQRELKKEKARHELLETKRAVNKELYQYKHPVAYKVEKALTTFVSSARPPAQTSRVKYNDSFHKTGSSIMGNSFYTPLRKSSTASTGRFDVFSGVWSNPRPAKTKRKKARYVYKRVKVGSRR